MRIAVVGSGISGLATAWLLAERHAVTLFEAAARPGGHTHTVEVTLDGVSHGVDTGFLVFNHKTYPNLVALFRQLGVPTAASEMSFSLSLEAPHIEWSGDNLDTLFAQRRNLLRPAFLRMLRDVLRFNREAAQDAQAPQAADATQSLGAVLARRGYSAEFRDWYLLPMAAAIWSCPTRSMLEYPFASFARFFRNHGLLELTDRPQWLTVAGGARQYVDRLLARLRDVRLATRVLRARRDASGVTLDFVHNAPGLPRGSERFDALVLGCHSDQALQILGVQASGAERALLEAIPYQPNRAVLHTDAALLPRNRRLWSAWNYSAGADGPDGRAVGVHYLINKLQPLPFSAPVVVSLNPHREPAPEAVIAEFDYAHPVFDARSADAQAALAGLQGVNRTWFCGAWTRYGFHEDGLRSALTVANALGVRAPWQAAAQTPPADRQLEAA
ncbi:MAG: NADH-ubiquinone oxidoreductase subunit 6 [Betaproteobacteria bacterium SG8_39]|nr:MAG: NADH-ubiquinone oxidoreductase subunit 6 [Betaproteobacteria bacterium SG8_39]